MDSLDSFDTILIDRELRESGAVDVVAYGGLREAYKAVAAFALDRDMGKLKWRADVKPVLFHVQRPSIFILNEVLGEIKSIPARQRMAFKFYCHRVHQDGKSLFEAVHPDRGAAQGAYVLEQSRTMQGWLAPDSYLEAIGRRFSAQAINEIGDVIMRFAELSEDNKAPFDLLGGPVARLT